MILNAKVAVFILIAAVGAISIFCYFRILHRLKTAHPTIWHDLGEPGFLKRRSADQRKKETIEGFLFRRRYKLLNDPVLTIYGNISLVTVSISTALAIVWSLFLAGTDINF